MGVTTVYQDCLLRSVVRNASAGRYINYVCLLTGVITEDDITTAALPQPTGLNYSPKLATYGPANWKIQQSGIGYKVHNNTDLVFPKASGAWGLVTHFAIIESGTNDNVAIWGALDESIDVVANDVPTFQSGDLEIVITGAFGDLGEYNMLRYIFHGLQPTPDPTYVGLSTAAPSEDGSTKNELSTHGYGRVFLDPNSSYWASTYPATPVQIYNSGLIQFPYASDDWSSATHFFVSSTGVAGETGNTILCYGQLAVAKTVQQGDLPVIGTGEITLTLQ